MRVEGTVLGMKGDRAVVRVAAGESCGTGCCSCATSAFCGAPQVEAEVDQPVEPGWQVMVEMPSRGSALSTLLVFVLPLLGLVGGVLLGEQVGERGDASGLVIGFGLFVALFVLASLVDRKYIKPRLPEPRIVSILDHGGSAA